VAVFVGLDVHRAQIASMRWIPRPGEVRTGRVRPGDRCAFRLILRAFDGSGVVATVEAMTGWRLVVRELQAIGAEVHLAEPAEVSTRRDTTRRAKTDRLDETLTVTRLGVCGALRKTLPSPRFRADRDIRHDEVSIDRRRRAALLPSSRCSSATRAPAGGTRGPPRLRRCPAASARCAGASCATRALSPGRAPSPSVATLRGRSAGACSVSARRPRAQTTPCRSEERMIARVARSARATNRAAQPELPRRAAAGRPRHGP
jgi:hypothetical protein